MSIVVIGDVGVLDEMVHIGDEAMFDEFIVQARARGIRNITGISANPAETAARYDISTVERIGFTGSRDRMIERMTAVLADTAHPVAKAIRASDGVVVTGGGNMSSLWPMHIFERATIAAIAAREGKPFVVSGQTIGPDLTTEDGELVATLLEKAALASVREPASFALCASLGLSSITQTIDDASFLGFEVEPTENYCLVTLANHVGDHDRDTVEAGIARLLDHVASSTGLEIVFSPHFGSLTDEPRGDSLMHNRVRALMTAASREIPATDSTASARLARRASLVISSRYHPVVFAVSAGVPTIGIPVDNYTGVKLAGALGNFGQSSALPAESLEEGAALVDAVWRDRSAIRERGLVASVDNRAASQLWWDRVIDAIYSSKSR